MQSAQSGVAESIYHGWMPMQTCVRSSAIRVSFPQTAAVVALQTWPAILSAGAEKI